MACQGCSICAIRRYIAAATMLQRCTHKDKRIRHHPVPKTLAMPGGRGAQCWRPAASSQPYCVVGYPCIASCANTRHPRTAEAPRLQPVTCGPIPPAAGLPPGEPAAAPSPLPVVNVLAMRQDAYMTDLAGIACSGALGDGALPQLLRLREVLPL